MAALLQRLTTVVMLLLPVSAVSAQDDPQYRMQIGGGIGMENYLGDYNGNLTRGFQPMACLVGRYEFNPVMALRMHVAYGKLEGASKNVETYYPAPNEPMRRDDYSFKTPLVDAAVVVEYNFWAYGTGRDYRGARRFTPYAFIGIGFNFAHSSSNSVSANNFSFNLPVGLGVKYRVGRRVNLGLDYTLHFTQSDKLDGRKDPYGISSSGLFKNTDAWTSLTFTVTYSFSERCNTCNKDD